MMPVMGCVDGSACDERGEEKTRTTATLSLGCCEYGCVNRCACEVNVESRRASASCDLFLQVAHLLCALARLAQLIQLALQSLFLRLKSETREHDVRKALLAARPLRVA
jgi:hypothetical protein